ncbi:MAG: outer membrane protein assembly factor BamD [Bacteroidota bacterium]
MRHRTPFIVLLLGFLSSAHAEQRERAPCLHKYHNALVCYHAKDYNKAHRLFEEAIPLLSGKKESIAATFYQACSNFYRRSLVKLKKHYENSAREFKYFYQTYPNAPQAPEALYMQGYALYLASPDVERDQATTQEAIQTFQTYLDRYPAGPYRDKALQYRAELYDKLAYKAFNNAKLYHKLSHYQAAVTALTVFQQDFPGTPLGEAAAYLKTDAQYKLAKKSAQEEQQDRLKTTLTYCRSFLDRYPASRHVQAVEKIYAKALSQSNKPDTSP